MLISISPDVAEFIGIMLGDGNIYKNLEKWQYQLDVSINSVDEPKYAIHVKNLMEKIFQKPVKLSYQKGKAISLRYYNKEIVEFLLELLLKAGKKTMNQVNVPKLIFSDKNYIKSCLKGLFDTDGSIAIDNAKDLRIFFTNTSKKLVSDFKNMCLILQIEPSPKIKYNNKRKAWRVVIAKKDEIKAFLEEIKPEKIKESFRRIWLASQLIYLNSPEQNRIEISRRIDKFLLHSDQSQFRYSKKNALYLKKLCERFLDVIIDSDKINITISKALTLEKFIYHPVKVQNLIKLFEKLRSADRIVEYLVDCGELLIPHRLTICKQIKKYFIETNQNFKEWHKQYPSYRIGITERNEVKYFPVELRNQLISIIFKILSNRENDLAIFDTITLLKMDIQKINLFIVSWMLKNPKYNSAIENYLINLVILCKRIKNVELTHSEINITKLSACEDILFNRKIISLILDYILSSKKKYKKN